MTKKGPLSKTEVFWIKNFYQTKDADALAAELDRAKGLVEECIELCKAEDAAANPINAGSQFGYNGRGSVVSTQAASEHADDIRKAFRTRGNVARPSCVTGTKPSPKTAAEK